MRCLLCNAEMTLMNVVHDDTILVTGFEHHTFICSSCHDVEQRLVFVRAEEPIPATQSIAGEQGGSRSVSPSPDTTLTIKPTPFDEHAVALQDAPVIGVQDEPAFAVQDKPVIAFQDAPIVGVQDEPAFVVQDKPVIALQGERTAAVEEEHAVAVQDEPPAADQDEPAAPGNERAATATIFTRVVARLRGR
jgi:hypothetical protein